MGGKVLVFPHDIVYDEGISVGTQNTKKESAFEMFDDGLSCEKVARYIHETIENVKILEKEWNQSSKTN